MFDGREHVDARLILRRIQTLRLEVRRLDNLRAELKALQGLLVEQKMNRVRESGGRLGPTKAIMAILEGQPRSLKEVVDLAAEQVDSQATDVRKTLYTVLRQLRKHGVVVQQDDGDLVLQRELVA